MSREHMTPCERVLAVLKRQPVDRIPWIEGIVENGIGSEVSGQTVNVDWSVAPDGFSKQDGMILANEQKKVNRALGKANLQFCAFAPVFADKMVRADDGSPVLVGDGKIKTHEDFEKLFKLPDPKDSSFITNAKRFIANKEDYCACACIRLGIGATLLSMGIEAFSYAMVDNPSLIEDIHSSYAAWTAEVVPVLEELGFDLIWAFDDVAFNSGPVFNPEFYKRHILPVEQAVVKSFTKPLITHSDGNMTVLTDTWLTLGQAAIHPIQPDVMDIEQIKRKYGEKVCLIGNVFMEDLVDKNPKDIEEYVKWLIENIGKGGGYILSSSNSLTDNMKPQNVLTIKNVLEGKYGMKNLE